MKKEESTALCKSGENRIDTNVESVPVVKKEPVTEERTEEKKSEKTGKFLKKLTKKQIIIICSILAAVVVIIVLLCILCCSPSTSGRSGGIFGKDPEDILETYLDAVESNDAQEIADLHHPKVIGNSGAELVESSDVLYTNCGGMEIEKYTVASKWDAGDYYGGSTSYFVEYYSEHSGIDITEMTVLVAEISVNDDNLSEDYLDINKDGEVCAGFIFYKVDGTWYIDTVTEIDE